MPTKERSVCDKPTQFNGVGAQGRSISIDLDRPDQPSTIFRNPVLSAAEAEQWRLARVLDRLLP
jgi:hypothetical protein